MRRIAIEEASPGMVVGRSILTESGELLLARGVRLNDRYVDSLRQRGYSSIVIEDDLSRGVTVPETISTQVRAAATRRLNETFACFQQATSELKDKSTREIVKGLESRSYANEADRIDPYRVMIDDIRAMLDDLMTVDVMDGLNAIKIHDDYLLQHSIDVTVVALLIGKRLKVDNRELRMLALGCLMHDLGKTLVDRSIISKPGRLTTGERAKVNTHPHLGYLMLRSSGSPHDLLGHHVAYQHHEQQDGQGYPRGLVGSNRVYRSRHRRYDSDHMLLIAEIAAVANVYEALSSRRPYRSAYPHEKIPAVLNEVAGAMLNAAIVEQFLGILPLIPTGVAIEVTAGTHAGYSGLVARVDRLHLKRPWVRLTHDAQGRPVDLPDIDMLDHEDMEIRSLPADASARTATPVAAPIDS